MTETADLIARLEQAPEGSRELDAAIVEAVYPKLMEQYVQRPRMGPGYWVHKDGERHGLMQAEFYTTSIDAALTLIHEHMKRVGRSGYEIHLREVDGEWVFFEITIPSYEFQGRSHTSIPLAACQAWARLVEHDAALRARLSKMEQ